MAPTYQERLRWFPEARFGMIIHWGCIPCSAGAE